MAADNEANKVIESLMVQRERMRHSLHVAWGVIVVQFVAILVMLRLMGVM